MLISEKVKFIFKKEKNNGWSKNGIKDNKLNVLKYTVYSILIRINGEKAEIAKYNHFKCDIGLETCTGSSGYPIKIIIQNIAYDLTLIR